MQLRKKSKILVGVITLATVCFMSIAVSSVEHKLNKV